MFIIVNHEVMTNESINVDLIDMYTLQVVQKRAKKKIQVCRLYFLILFTILHKGKLLIPASLSVPNNLHLLKSIPKPVKQNMPNVSTKT